MEVILSNAEQQKGRLAILNRKETSNILSLLKAAYPNQFRNMKKNDAETMLMLWMMQFQKEEYQDVLNAVQEHISNNDYIPSVAQIKKCTEKTLLIDAQDEWHKRFGYGSDPIYYDDDFSESVIWNEVPKDIRDRMQYHCNPKDYEEYNATAQMVIDLTGNTHVKFYGDADTEFLKGKLTTWKNELLTQNR